LLQPQGLSVVVESNHLCMVMRGVQKTGAITTTSCMLGCLRSTAKNEGGIFEPYQPKVKLRVVLS
jgi:GTP cyclohydrolase I